MGRWSRVEWKGGEVEQLTVSAAPSDPVSDGLRWWECNTCFSWLASDRTAVRLSPPLSDVRLGVITNCRAEVGFRGGAMMG